MFCGCVTAEGVSYYPCSQIYCGPRPASEPETTVVQDEARRLANELQGWLTMHSYGSMWMFPYATTIAHSPDSPCQRAPDHHDLVFTPLLLYYWLDSRPRSYQVN